MDYVHFDHEAVAAAIRDAARASFELALTEAPDEASRAFVMAQHRFTDAVAEVFAVFVDLRNDGVPEKTAVCALGVNLGTIISLAIMNAQNPEEAILRINNKLSRTVESALVGGRPGFSRSARVFVDGELGGRA